VPVPLLEAEVIFEFGGFNGELLHLPVGVALKNSNKQRSVINQGHAPAAVGASNQILEPLHDWLFEGIRKKEYICVVGKDIQNTSGTNLDVRVFPKSALSNFRDMLIQFHSNDLFSESAAKPPIDDTAFPAADINQDIRLPHTSVEKLWHYAILSVDNHGGPFRPPIVVDRATQKRSAIPEVQYRISEQSLGTIIHSVKSS
jgi:hypothetical protein